MGKEKLQKVCDFDPEFMADLEIKGIQYEFADDQDAKFANEVETMQKLYGLSEISAYRLVAKKNMANDKTLTSDQTRNKTIEYYETLSKETGLGFDAYEAALAQEKLNVANKEDNKEKIIQNLAKLYSVQYSKPVEKFLEACRLRTESLDLVWSNIGLALMGTPAYFLGGSADEVKSVAGSHMDYDEIKESFLKAWVEIKNTLKD